MNYRKALVMGTAVGLLLSGCGGTETDGSAAVTVESQCRQVMQAFCNRAYADCTQSKENLDACVSAGTTSCCGDHCSAAAGSLQSSLNQCTAEVRQIPCSSLVDPSTIASSVPTDCRGVVRPAFADVGMDLESAVSAGLTAR